MPATKERPDDAWYWERVAARDAEMDGVFVYAVTTTGVYCRPSCPSRRPRAANVRYFSLNSEAEAAGFRPCRRCNPAAPSPAQRAARAVEAACLTLERAEVAPTLTTLAETAGVSPFYFQRTFKAHTGLTPRQYFAAKRGGRSAAALSSSRSVTEAALSTGFQSLSRHYDDVAARYGMAPGALRAGGLGELIVTAQTTSPLGWLSAAFSRKGIAALRLTEGAADGIGEIMAIFPRALIVPGGADFDHLVADVAGAINEPECAVELPLDVRGTAFQERVWMALRQIPVGSTATYSEVAAAIAAPGSHRAVARACAANRIAVLIPCHRVVRADGSLAGYRWGPERKAALLSREKADG